MASRKDAAPAPTKYVWNTIFPNIVRKNIKKPYRNHFELIHCGVGLFLEHFKSPPSLLKSWPRPHKWLQKNLFPPNIAIPNGNRKSIIPNQANNILKNREQNKWSPISINNHTNVSFSSHRYPPSHFNASCRTVLCTFPASYTHCFFYYRIAPTMYFNRCQRTSIFAYSAGNTSFFIDTCHSFCQCSVPLSNLIPLLYLKKCLRHSQLP